LAAHTQDDAFHEIQLNGKQLVFLFMAATVVSVVIFLCGVLVGRGVRVERGDLTRIAGRESPVDVTPAPPPATTPVPSSRASDPTAAAPPPAVDELSYFNRLEKPNPPAEKLKAASPKGRPAPAQVAAATSSSATSPPPSSQPVTSPPVASQPAAPRPDATEPGSLTGNLSPDPGYAVQIAALNVRSEADAMAKRLASKGYAAYVLTPADGTPSVYRVRIGTFKTRREAEAMATRLQKEEQFKPWITK
jgi:cell division septation protein DedD